MPRPSKRVAPDTLGGRLRTARQSLHLSLAEVAGSRYSTSLISQIERNRVDPSTESLHYLSERLQLSFDDLQILARQHRESETEANLYRAYEEKYSEINQLLARKRSEQALVYFEKLDPMELPLFLRWRTLALRGQAYFEQREFSTAQRDFQSALTILPASISEEYQLEVIKLRLHMAEATRELNQFGPALAHYQGALASMDASTSLRYVAEAYWGIALVYYRQALNVFVQNGSKPGGHERNRHLLQEAWQHAENARRLYHSISDNLNADLLQCQMALIEQALGETAQGKQRLQAVLETWKPTLEEHFQPDPKERPHRQDERANVVSAAACYLAGIESQAQHFEAALEQVELAIQAGKKSYKVRQAEAFMMKGQILEARDAHDPIIADTYQEAVNALQDTGRWGSMSQARYELGRYLLSIGKADRGEKELEMARELAGIPRNFSAILPTEEQSSDNG